VTKPVTQPRTRPNKTCLRMRRRAWQGPDVTVLLGDKHKFAVEIGEGDGGLRRVDLWAAGQWLTCDDNMVFVAQFVRDVKDTAAWLRLGGGSPLPFSGLSPEASHRQLVQTGGESRNRFRALEWGPTTDNVTILLFRHGDRLALTFEFWRERYLLSHPANAGKIFLMAISVVEFVGILDGLLAALDAGQSLVPQYIRQVHRRSMKLSKIVDPQEIFRSELHCSALLDRVAEQPHNGLALRAFMASVAFAALRPAEALALRVRDVELPEEGPGTLLIPSSARMGSGGRVGSVGASRRVPVSPRLAVLLRTEWGPKVRSLSAKTDGTCPVPPAEGH
jgi:hypothetical protein